MRPWLALVGLVAACRAAPPPHGEVLVIVDTDVPVPLMVSRLRVDLFTEDGRWFESRDYPARAPRDWPLSFSVWSDHDVGRKTVRARLRAFPEARTRTYLGERFEAKPSYAPPPMAHDLTSLCSAPPTIELGRIAVVRTGPDRFFSLDCEGAHVDGSAGAVRFRVEHTQRIRLGILQRLPRAGAGLVTLRRSCGDPASTIACAPNTAASLLGPGTYDAIVGSHGEVADPRWSESTLLIAPDEEWATLARGVAPWVETGGPRLIREGDATPPLEPLPATAIDRIVDLPIRAHERAIAHVVLRGACAGTMADLGDGRTCTEREGVLAKVEPHPLDPWGSVPPRAEGSFTPTSSCARPSSPERVCMPGGAFLLGEREHQVKDGTPGPALLFATPERPVRVAPFLIDRTEISWRRLRALIARGLTPPDLGGCASPTDDELPVTCVTHAYARAACRFAEGDLPTEAEWEWAASASDDRGSKRRYPWGDATPTSCAAANVGACVSDLGAAQRVDGEPWSSSDRTPFGVVGMLGNVREWTVDAAARFDSIAWRAAPVTGASLDDDGAAEHVVRGLSFWQRAFSAGILVRTAQTSQFGLDDVGFRCVYR